MAIQKLTALEQGNPANSTGVDVASSVNLLVDLAEATDLSLKDLGTFLQGIIPDNSTLTEALQALETFSEENKDRLGNTITRSLTTQVLPLHDGSAATELVVDFGTAAIDSHSLSGGVVTILQDLLAVTLLVEIHVTKTGGGQSSNITLWVEASADGGTTWTPTTEPSLRAETIEKNGNVTLTYDMSVTSPISAGVKFRIVATNTLLGTLSIEAPPTLVTSKGIAEGFASKLNISAKVS